MKKETTELNELLKFDGLHEAEKLTKKSYKEDKSTESLGFLMSMMNNEKKKEILLNQKDSYFGMTPQELKEILQEEGFELVYERSTKKEDTYRNKTESIPYTEQTTLYCYWSEQDKCLAKFDVYPSYKEINGKIIREQHQDSVNGGSFFYCVKSSWENLRGITSSGCYDSDLGVWNGDHDIREGFRHNLNNLRQAGELVNWTKEHFLWLLTFHDTKIEDYDYEATNKEALNKFPDNVLVGMGLKGENNEKL